MIHSQAYKEAVKNFAGSKLFFKVFDETIALVQKASDYLDGAGRFDQVKLDGAASASFANYSVQMTNRLMHVSSWLLSHRAYFKGDLSEPKDINFSDFTDFQEPLSLDKLTADLPTRFVVLLTQSSLLFERIIRIDEQLRSFDNKETLESTNQNQVHNQLQKLKDGLGIPLKTEVKDDILYV